MQYPDSQSPDPSELRAWQRFVTDNLEFRLGTAIGAVVARAWTDGSGDPLSVPTLEDWRATTGLPWFGFWARELLRWGTLDPFVAFTLAQGLAKTRDEAVGRRSEFERWINDEYESFDADDLIDPQFFLEWQRSLPHTAYRSRACRKRCRECGVDRNGWAALTLRCYSFSTGRHDSLDRCGRLRTC